MNIKVAARLHKPTMYRFTAHRKDGHAMTGVFNKRELCAKLNDAVKTPGYRGCAIVEVR